MKTFKKIASLVLAALLALGVMPAAAEDAPVQPELGARVKDIIEVDGYRFRDLNDNGELDPYEDWRLTAEERADDLLGKMDIDQQAAQMVHLTLVSKKDSWFTGDNVGFALVYEYIFDMPEDDEEEEDEEDEDAVKVTGSAMNDRVINGSIFFGTPILWALAVMRRTFLLT